MFSIKQYFISLTLILPALNLTAQNLTGTWEGALSTDQFLQLNIIQTGDRICGYTFDYVKADERSFCKSFFEGRFNSTRKILFIEGRYFLKTTRGHRLMYLRLKYKMEKGVEVLEEEPVKIINYRERNSLFGTETERYETDDSTEYVYLKKVASQPYELIDLMRDCIARDKKETDSLVKKIVPLKDRIRPVVKIITPEKPKDSMPSVIAAPVEKKADSVTLTKTLAQRKNKEQKRIEVDVQTINLKVYDNAIIDGDTVSILYNGRMLLAHQLLSEKGIELNIELDEKQTRHEITLFAENLGSIPPNTALVVITAGNKRYELFASASLEENAVLVFEYKPK
jgi:hypothetical protein